MYMQLEKNYEFITFGNHFKVPGVLAFPVMPQGIELNKCGTVKILALDITYEELINLKEILLKFHGINPGITWDTRRFRINNLN